MILIKRRYNLIRVCLLFLVVWSLPSCNENKDDVNQPSNNEFSIQPNKQNIIQGTQGSILIIPADALVYEDGSEIQEAVTVKLEEAYALSDIMDKNLDTRTANKLLVTGGMVSLEATTESGKKVVLVNNKGITLQVAENSSDTNGFKFFNQSEAGWENPQKPNPYLTYWPVKQHALTYMYVDSNNSEYWESLQFSRSSAEINGLSLVDSLSLVDFLNHEYNVPDFVTDELIDQSFLSSKEYEDRFFALPLLGEYNVELHRTYVKNLDKPLWVADSLAMEVLKEDLSYFDEEEKKDYSYRFLMECYNNLKKFKAEGKTTFAEERFTAEELENLRIAYKKLGVNKFIQSYSIRKLGWHNIDYFYNKVEMTPTSFTVDCNEGARRVALILTDIKSVIRGKVNGSNQFCFGFAGECEARLPHMKAYLIGMGEKDGKLLFAKKEIQIGETPKESLKLKPITQEALVKELQAIEQGYQ